MGSGSCIACSGESPGSRRHPDGTPLPYQYLPRRAIDGAKPVAYTQYRPYRTARGGQRTGRIGRPSGRDGTSGRPQSGNLLNPRSSMAEKWGRGGNPFFQFQFHPLLGSLGSLFF
ncbi:hypothetical protein BO70DRAFT_196950 [Aspergillus heteromorphus CBS 117.55]|uniref:Uncharacterized protein n=1 Tax=Aspergillus heteromorphus CBS 117.55 TaxID=1448321 RepID=A0A317WNK2_9EURO|nr:uncharacterized protein BO70DRAFT_196950 [Aspergillus heteromorphus CBS 117.55]PWY87575.1 hypothetical protein BO70DRAFT_196950 [Aspergillus heteromorphus CBS 117.55]